MTDQTDSYNQLKGKIKSLKENRDKHEALILKDLSVVYSIAQSPAPYLKQVTRELAGDQDFRTNLVRIGLNLGTNYLYKILSRPEKGTSLLSMLIEKLGLKNEKKAGGFAELLTRLLSKLSKEGQPE